MAVPSAPAASVADALGEGWNHRDRGWHEGWRGGDRGYYRDAGRRDYYRVPSWRGRDGRYYCRRSDGTTGLLIGGAAGALIGRGVAGRGDRTVGTVLGLAGGALLGREIDRSGSRCR